jgi:hypothetical protein
MTKEIIIAVLVMALIYLYYQQNTQPKLASNSQDHQTLYQKRVQKDLGDEEIIKLKDQKITDLETQLLDLAKQKLKGKKEITKLTNQLETKEEISQRKFYLNRIEKLKKEIEE